MKKKTIYSAFIVKVKFLLLTFFTVVFCCCTTLLDYECPYILSSVQVQCGESSGNFKFAGVMFDFYNSSEKTISEVEFSFRLYDSEGENPFIGTNCITATKTETIGSNSTSLVIVSLDNVITVVSEEPYQIDYLYVTKIKYVDGSVWKDEYGIYAL